MPPTYPFGKRFLLLPPFLFQNPLPPRGKGNDICEVERVARNFTNIIGVGGTTKRASILKVYQFGELFIGFPYFGTSREITT